MAAFTGVARKGYFGVFLGSKLQNFLLNPKLLPKLDAYASRINLQPLKNIFLLFKKVLILSIYLVFLLGGLLPGDPQKRQLDPPVTAVELVFLIQMKNDTLMPDCHSNQYHVLVSAFMA